MRLFRCIPMNTDEIRAVIDEIDAAMLALLDKRASCSLRMGQAKKQKDFTFRPLREIKIHEKIKNYRPHHHYNESSLHLIWRIIMTDSIAMQSTLKVFYQREHSQILQSLCDKLFAWRFFPQPLCTDDFFDSICRSPKAIYFFTIDRTTVEKLPKIPFMKNRLFIEYEIENHGKKINENKIFAVTISDEKTMEDLPLLTIGDDKQAENLIEIYRNNGCAMFLQKLDCENKNIEKNLQKKLQKKLLGRYIRLPFTFRLSNYARFGKVE